MTGRRKSRLKFVLFLVVAMLGVSTSSAGAAASHQLIEGSGSSWATNALNVWIANVTSNGLKVVFTSTGSATGRKDFGNQTTDFAVSDIGYQGQDPQTGDTDLPCKLGSSSDCRAYAYLPIVSGGTSFPYHIEVAGQLVRNLRLSGETLAKIFTGQITNWNDDAITKDNNGRKLPSLPIIPVNHAEGSGSTAQFTTYLDSMYPSIWRGYTGKPGETEYYPNSPNAIAQTGSDGVINFITSAAANGSIGYDEYSYALAKNYPVAKVENAAGYFTLPTQFNVAVALQKAQINTDKTSKNYLLQNLSQVYRFNDPRTYALSSYSYMIIPTAANDSRMTTAKRQTLADFIYYSVCDGQGQVGPVGYSSLPLNLVKRSFEQTARLKQADTKVDLTNRDVTSCNNPTFVPGNLSANHLAQIAPQPPACDKSAAGPCTDGGNNGTSGVPVSGGSNGGSNGGGSNGGSNGGGSNGGGSNGGGSNGGGSNGGGSNGGGSNGGGSNGGGSNGGGSNGGGSNGGTIGGSTGTASTGSGGSSVGGGGSTTGTGATGGVAGGGATKIDPDTGQVVPATGGGGDSSAAAAVGVPTEVAYRQPNMTNVLAPLAALEMLAVLVLPPVFYYAVLRRRRRNPS